MTTVRYAGSQPVIKCVDGCGSHKVPGRSPARPPGGPWTGRTGPGSWVREAGTEFQHCFEVHSQDRGLHPWHRRQGWACLPPGLYNCSLTMAGRGRAQYCVPSGSLEMQIRLSPAWTWCLAGLLMHCGREGLKPSYSVISEATIDQVWWAYLPPGASSLWPRVPDHRPLQGRRPGTRHGWVWVLPCLFVYSASSRIKAKLGYSQALPGLQMSYLNPKLPQNHFCL